MLIGGAGVVLVTNAYLAGSGGLMNMSVADLLRSAGVALLVAFLVRVPVLRIGALLAAGLVVAMFVIPSPVGLNATRLATVFALPVLAGWAAWPGVPGRRLPGGVRLAGVLALATLIQPPVIVADLADAGNPSAERSYFEPLLAELKRRPPGRVEVPPTRDYWEAAHVAADVPLARGWLRQVDIEVNPLFFPEEHGGSADTPLGSDDYRRWLVDNGVSYVALADARLSWVARREAALIRTGPDYLRPVWRSAHWTLYEVAGVPSIVDGGRLVAATGSAVTFDAPAAGEVTVRVRPSRWLTIRGPAGNPPTGPLTPVGADRPLRATISAAGQWSIARVPAAGRYTVTSAW